MACIVYLPGSQFVVDEQSADVVDSLADTAPAEWVKLTLANTQPPQTIRVRAGQVTAVLSVASQ